MRSLACKSTCVLVLAAFAVSASTVVPATTQGWIDSLGTDNGSSPFNNYFTGFCLSGCGLSGPAEFRNWFHFDVPALTGSVVSAQLEINAGTYDSPDASETFQATAIPSIFAFGDLGTGTVYGSRAFTAADNAQNVLIDLDAAAVAAISGGNPFLVGGRLTTLSGQTSADEALFATTGLQGLLIITTTEDLPEPAAWMLAAAGLLALVAFRRLGRARMRF
ncbi:MAG TPA: hypothetical protein VGF59_20540 [Bryobacteraceae bacterium]